MNADKEHPRFDLCSHCDGKGHIKQTKGKNKIRFLCNGYGRISHVFAKR